VLEHALPAEKAGFAAISCFCIYCDIFTPSFKVTKEGLSG
jgi:hypothetical protein